MLRYLVLCLLTLASTTAFAQDFKPARLLPGARKRLPAAGASFTLPKGWVGEWASDEVYALAPKGAAANGAGGQGGVFMTGAPLGGQQLAVPMVNLLESQATEVGARFDKELPGVSQLPWQVVEQGVFAGGRKGRLLLRAQTGQGVLEAYVALIKVQDFLYTVAGLWMTTPNSNYLAAADTVFASLKVKPPAPNQQLMGRVAGCWKYYEGSTDSGGHGSTNRTYRFDPRGLYSYHSSTWIRGCP